MCFQHWFESGLTDFVNFAEFEKAEFIKSIKSAEFWAEVTIEKLEAIRRELRGIIKYVAKPVYEPPQPKFIDLHDGQEKFQRLPTKLKFAEMPGYRP